MVTLSKLTPGETGVVEWIAGDDSLRDKAMEYGLVEGAEIKVLSVQGGDMILLVGKKKIALGEELAARIRV